jgi:hypothetical protein
MLGVENRGAIPGGPCAPWDRSVNNRVMEAFGYIASVWGGVVKSHGFNRRNRCVSRIEIARHFG